MTAVVVADPEARALLGLHRLTDPSFVHTNLTRAMCACAGFGLPVRPRQTGNVCSNCGGMAVQTGTCTTCVECGESGGCG